MFTNLFEWSYWGKRKFPAKTNLSWAKLKWKILISLKGKQFECGKLLRARKQAWCVIFIDPQYPQYLLPFVLFRALHSRVYNIFKRFATEKRLSAHNPWETTTCGSRQAAAPCWCDVSQKMLKENYFLSDHSVALLWNRIKSWDGQNCQSVICFYNRKTQLSQWTVITKKNFADPVMTQNK